MQKEIFSFPKEIKTGRNGNKLVSAQFLFYFAGSTKSLPTSFCVYSYKNLKNISIFHTTQ
jgi:hypothetical protein